MANNSSGYFNPPRGPGYRGRYQSSGTRRGDDCGRGGARRGRDGLSALGHRGFGEQQRSFDITGSSNTGDCEVSAKDPAFMDTCLVAEREAHTREVERLQTEISAVRSYLSTQYDALVQRIRDLEPKNAALSAPVWRSILESPPRKAGDTVWDIVFTNPADTAQHVGLRESPEADPVLKEGWNGAGARALRELEDDFFKEGLNGDGAHALREEEDVFLREGLSGDGERAAAATKFGPPLEDEIDWSDENSQPAR
jgi:hypothetical protein